MDSRGGEDTKLSDRGLTFTGRAQGGVVRSRSEALVGVQGSSIVNFQPFLSCSTGF